MKMFYENDDSLFNTFEDECCQVGKWASCKSSRWTVRATVGKTLNFHQWGGGYDYKKLFVNFWWRGSYLRRFFNFQLSSHKYSDSVAWIITCLEGSFITYITVTSLEKLLNLLGLQELLIDIGIDTDKWHVILSSMSL